MRVADLDVSEARSLAETRVRFSICTLVTKPEQYAGMVASFRERGFLGDDCEYIAIDNSIDNSADAYTGGNSFITAASGEFIIICHQDILLIDNRKQLEERLAELTTIDGQWAVCGNSGGVSPLRLATRITDPHGVDQKTMAMPARVMSLDENFLVLKRSANVGFSWDLSGFHLYGTDICIMADIMGRTAWVIDFHLEHLSPGTRDDGLMIARKALVDKYARAFRMRWIRSTCEIMFLSGLLTLSRLFSTSWNLRLLNRLKLTPRSYSR